MRLAHSVRGVHGQHPAAQGGLWKDYSSYRSFVRLLARHAEDHQLFSPGQPRGGAESLGRTELLCGEQAIHRHRAVLDYWADLLSVDEFGDRRPTVSHQA